MKKDKKKYGCVMLFFDFPEIKKIHDKIDSEDIYNSNIKDEYGLEKESHVTLLYGLHNDIKDKDVFDIIKNQKFNNVFIENPSIFDNEEYDVFKFDVKENKNLNSSNKDLKTLPFTSDYPDYHPHLTIGYLKKGMGKKYIKLLKEENYKLIPKFVVYSKSDGTKQKLTLSKI